MQWVKVEPETDARGRTVYTVTPPEKLPSRGYRALKRGFDFLLALFASIVLSPVMLVIALLVWCTSKGPAVYRQERLGINGKPFTIYKFRSMYVDAEQGGPQWAEKNDDRCTPVGRFLRKCRLDELPQLWNILFGQMSFVGPRPERACFYREFEEYIHGFSYRLQAKPGLTGLAQIEGGYDFLPEEKIAYDMQYISEATAWMDLKLIFRTVRLVFTHEGAR